MVSGFGKSCRERGAPGWRRDDRKGCVPILPSALHYQQRRQGKLALIQALALASAEPVWSSKRLPLEAFFQRSSSLGLILTLQDDLSTMPAVLRLAWVTTAVMRQDADESEAASESHRRREVRLRLGALRRCRTGWDRRLYHRHPPGTRPEAGGFRRRCTARQSYPHNFHETRCHA